MFDGILEKRGSGTDENIRERKGDWAEPEEWDRGELKPGSTLA